MADSDLIAQPLNAPSSFNWVLLIELLLCGVLAIFFLSFFDRLFATVVSYGIRAYTWRTYQAYIDIQALQISLLGGRIFFKDIRYHAHNETILIHSGYITWHYWYRKVRKAEIFTDPGPGSLRRDKHSPNSSQRTQSGSLDKEERGGGGGGGGGTRNLNSNLPCRIKIKIEGVQAFLYNRSPVYDAIIDNMSQNLKQHRNTKDGEESSSSTARNEMKTIVSALEKLTSKASRESLKNPSSPIGKEKHVNPVKDEKPAVPFLLGLLPIQVQCKTGAIVLGNENTKCIITAKFDTTTGTLDAGHAGPLDIYKLLFHFDVNHPIITMKPNVDFKAFQLATAARLKTQTKGKYPQSKLKRSPFWPWSASSGDSVRESSLGATNEHISPNFQANLPGVDRWQGLSRYLDENFHNEHEEWEGVEYATHSTLADCPRLGFAFHWDIPGPVPSSNAVLRDGAPARIDDINGSEPPEYGMEIQIHGGTVHYGPWTDRQRINFQNIFFPPIYADAVPGKPLAPGDTRVSTEFKIFVTIDEETTLRMPVKEPSKDWRWKGRAEGAAGRRGAAPNNTERERNKSKRRQFWKSSEKGNPVTTVRHYAWLDIKVAKDSTVNYTMDMVARKDGFRSNVDTDIRGLEILTSVNHGLLWRSGPLALDCDLSTPLGYNKLREWRFNVENDDLELFILRDHLFLLVDVVSDWTSGPPPEFFTFTPFRYYLDIRFRNFKLFLNTNDSNIINNPSELDDNHFVILHGRDLRANVNIPLDQFRPINTNVTFDVVGRDLALQLGLNSRNTVAEFVGPKDVAFLDEVTLDGSYVGYAETSTQLTDRLTFNIHGSKLTTFLFGFVIQRLITLKDNYFGDYIHFKTLEEFQDQSRGRQNDAEATAKAQQSNRSNDLDVIMYITASDVRGLLPTHVYNADENIAVDVSYISVDLRITNYYMDLQVDSSPLSVSYCDAITTDMGLHFSDGCTELFIESTNIVGHRVFGLPPIEPAYVCHWDLDVGKISGELSEEFTQKLASSLQGFAYTLDDDENSMPVIEAPLIHDVTFVRARTREIKVWLNIDKESLLLSTAPSTVDFNDWAGLKFSQRLSVLVPSITVACVDSASAACQGTRTGKASVETHALFKTSLSLTMLRRKPHFDEERKKQQDHIILQDSRTKRAGFLLHPTALQSSLAVSTAVEDPPAMGYPPIPHPVTLEASTLETGSNSPYLPVPRRSMTTETLSPLSTTGSTAGRRLKVKSSVSTFSLADSIRRNSTPRIVNTSVTNPNDENSSYQSDQETDRNVLPTSDHERQTGASSSSSVAFSSPLSQPYFPLHRIQPDDSELPIIPAVTSTKVESTESPILNPVYDKTIDPNLIHTSLIISTGSGVQGFCKPPAISAVTNIVDMIQPKSPEDLLDSFHIDVLSKVIDFEKRNSGKANSLELSLGIPSLNIRFLNPFVVDSDSTGIDQFDFKLDRLALTSKDRKLAASACKDNMSIAHCTLDSIEIAATENCPAQAKKAVILKTRIRDVLLWMASTQADSVNLSFRNLEGNVESEKVLYIASMIQRTVSLGQKYAECFISQQKNREARLAFLSYRLTLHGEELPDPPFMTRSSVALRASPNHVRNHDSWKIVNRFLHIYEHMSASEREKLKDECNNHFSDIPTNATAVIINQWDQWDTLDEPPVEKTLAMRYLLGNTMTPIIDNSALVERALRYNVRCHQIQWSINHGSSQSNMGISLLAVHFQNVPSSSPPGLMLVGSEKPTTKTMVQVHSNSVSAALKWEFVALVENILQMVWDLQHSTTHRFKDEVAAQPVKPKPSRNWNIVQAVLAIEKTSIRLETINLGVLLANEGFRISVIGEDRMSTGGGQFFSALLHAKTAWSEIQSNTSVLVRAEAESPSVYASREVPHTAAAEQQDEWRMAASSSKLSIAVKAELLDILEVVDCLIRDELPYFMKRISDFKDMSATGLVKVREDSGQIGLPKLNLALLMDSYQIDVALLQSITYSLSGSVGRISVTPSLRQMISLDLNFDLAQHAHDLISRAEAESHIISSLKLPPINGRLKIHRTHDRTLLDINTIIETIVLEASAVHGLLSTINRPEMSKTFNTIQEDLDTVKQRLQNAMESSRTLRGKSDDTSQPKFAYIVGLTVAGVNIRADAPGKLPNAGVASLSVGINCVYLKALNVSGDSDEILPLPEIHAQLQHLFVEMTITDNKGKRPCGNLGMSATIHCTLRDSMRGHPKRKYRVSTTDIVANVFAETASAVVDVLNHLQDRIKDLDLSRERRYLQRLRQPTRRPSMIMGESMYSDMSMTASGIFTSAFSVSLLGIRVSWIVGNSVPAFPGIAPQDLVLSIKMIDLRSKSQSTSRLTIEDLQLQMIPASQDRNQRSLNSALLPEMVFNVGYASNDEERKMSFQAAGKSLDLRLESQFILPADILQRSISLAVDKVRDATASWQMTPTSSGAERKNPFGDKRLSSLLIDVDFAGAVVTMRSSRPDPGKPQLGRFGGDGQTQGKYGQFAGGDEAAAATLRSPGIAVKIEYNDSGQESSFNAEVKVSGSTNTLSPSVVPLILDISNSVKVIVGDSDKRVSKVENKPTQTFLSDEGLLTTDPASLLGQTSLNLGIRIGKQEFSLSCQPIARVEATAQFENIYITANSVKSPDQDQFFAVSAAVEKLLASVQHVYSRESTFSFDVEKIMISMMNSKHLSGTAGICAILKIYPMRTHINGRQLQDFWVFREIWIPPEIRLISATPPQTSAEPQEYLVQRYQQVATAAAFPWTATVAIEKIEVNLDLGQAVGKSSLVISNMWASSKKASDWEQNLCLGIEKIDVEGTGRMSGFIDLADFQIRTSISWPTNEEGEVRKTPLIQASVGFDRLRVKAAFDYQPFVIADVASFAFIMYNVREQGQQRGKDRLVALLDGEKVHVCCTATSAAQGLALYQAVEKLVQEINAAYEQSMKDIEKYLRRKSVTLPSRFTPKADETPSKLEDDEAIKSPIMLHTDVVVSLRSISLGAFPSSFSNTTVFMLEASDVQARFAVKMSPDNRIQSGLSMTLGQLQVALTAAVHPAPRTGQEITVEEVVSTMDATRGGTILRVPKVVAMMQTWQVPATYHIDYIFKSSFEGKVDVGWNYTRISFIRGMWDTHSRTLVSRLGRALPESAVQIRTGGDSQKDDESATKESSATPSSSSGEKITAVVNVPQSRYEYRPLEPPIIETPQLRDMGEATPPLEWIGLHRERLPNVTHQIVIVGLLRIAREVEDAYERILGSNVK